VVLISMVVSDHRQPRHAALDELRKLRALWRSAFAVLSN
jgi:hypothetical protein